MCKRFFVAILLFSSFLSKPLNACEASSCSSCITDSRIEGFEDESRQAKLCGSWKITSMLSLVFAAAPIASIYWDNETLHACADPSKGIWFYGETFCPADLRVRCWDLEGLAQRQKPHCEHAVHWTVKKKTSRHRHIGMELALENSDQGCEPGQYWQCVRKNQDIEDAAIKHKKKSLIAAISTVAFGVSLVPIFVVFTYAGKTFIKCGHRILEWHRGEELARPLIGGF